MAPSLEYHAYSASQQVMSLSLPLQKAIERGLTLAVQSHFEGSIASLALFYERLGRFRDEGELLESPDCDSITAGLSTTQCLVLAGSAYSKAQNLLSAQRALDRAIQIEPDNIEGYQKLILLVFTPRHDLRSATELIHSATQNNVDPYALYLALSEAADVAGDQMAADAALSKAAELRPDLQALEALGLHYFNHNNFNRASFYLRRALEMRPTSAQIAFYLGLAEQSNYQYSSARGAYERAVALDPKNATYRATLDSLKRKVAENSSKH
jgi:tetratricopeptide (TPR) repeat protein